VKLVLAPKRRQPVRPKKQRRKDASEGPSGSGNIQWSYPVITCSRCGLEGNHNKFGSTNHNNLPKISVKFCFYCQGPN